MNKIPANIIISRTDSIGDVVLTLPMAGILKKKFPGVKVAFLGKRYTQPVIEACSNIDVFIDEEDFFTKDIFIEGQKPEVIIHVLPVFRIAKRARQMQIPLRIGTTNRLYHWNTCNRLIKLSRKNSALHEAQLNLVLLKPFGINKIFSLEEIPAFYGLEKLASLKPEFAGLIRKDKYNLILHPKSQGSAREWGINNFIQLIFELDKDRYKIFISGTEKEREFIQPIFDTAGALVTDITGKMNLSQFISFINMCDGLVANSTGPLHIAAALGKDAFGIYPPMRPVHPGRWRPVGINAQVFVENKSCSDCRKDSTACTCIKNIQPALLKNALDKKAKS